MTGHAYFVDVVRRRSGAGRGFAGALADLLRERKLADPATIRIAFINYR